jgi:hypothetical protein
MSNDEKIRKDETVRELLFAIRALSLIRHSSFGFRHFFLTSPGRDCLPEAGLCEIPPADVRRLSAAARRVSVAPG